MSNMVEHAKRELSMINEDPEFVEAYLKIVEIFAGMGHSGGSASIAIPTITALLEQQNLSPLTDNPEEWQFHDGTVWPPDGIWQNKRNGEAFSKDGGKTYYVLSEGPEAYGERPLHKSRSYEDLLKIQAARDI